MTFKEPIEGECLLLNGMEFQTVGAAYIKAYLRFTGKCIVDLLLVLIKLFSLGVTA